MGETLMNAELTTLTIEVTTGCNHSCLNCFALPGRENARMPISLAREILTESRDMGYRSLHITGGEPLLWGPLLDLLDHARDLGFENVLINTNGTLLNQSLAEKLAAINRTGPKIQLTISLNGSKERHDRIRGTGTYERAIRGIETALTCKVPVEIFTTVSRSLLEALPAFIVETVDRFSGATSSLSGISLIQMFRVPGSPFDFSSEMLNPEEFIVWVKMAGLLRLHGYPVSILNQVLSHVVAQRLGFKWLPDSGEISQWGKVTLRCTGELTGDHTYRRSFGDYSPGVLKQLLESADYMRETEPDTNECPQCSFVSLCRENGMAHPSEDFFNEGEDGSPFCRRVLESVKSMEQR